MLLLLLRRALATISTTWWNWHRCWPMWNVLRGLSIQWSASAVKVCIFETLSLVGQSEEVSTQLLRTPADCCQCSSLLLFILYISTYIYDSREHIEFGLYSRSIRTNIGQTSTNVPSNATNADRYAKIRMATTVATATKATYWQPTVTRAKVCKEHKRYNHCAT